MLSITLVAGIQISAQTFLNGFQKSKDLGKIWKMCGTDGLMED